jgi:uncharacterized membrane protein
MTLVEIIGNQHLRILALEETISQLQNQNSKLQERIVMLTPKNPQGFPAEKVYPFCPHCEAPTEEECVCSKQSAEPTCAANAAQEPGLNPGAQNQDSIGA